MVKPDLEITKFLIVLFIFLTVLLPLPNKTNIEDHTLSENTIEAQIPDKLSMEGNSQTINKDSPLNTPPLWEFNLTGKKEGDKFSSPQIGPLGNIFIRSHYYRSSTLHSLDKNGKQRWNRTFVDESVYNIQFGDEGQLYFLTMSGIGTNEVESYLYSIDNDGQLIWKTKLGNHIFDPKIELFDDYLYFASELGNLYKFDEKGNIIYNNRIASATSHPTVGDNNVIYIISNKRDNELIAVNLDGTILWNRSIPLQGDYQLTDFLIAPDSTIYTGFINKSGDYRSIVYGFDLKGNIKFSKTLDKGITHGSTIKGDLEGNIYFICSEDMIFYLLSLDHEGNVRWEYRISQGLPSGPVRGDNGHLYIGAKENSYPYRGYMDLYSFTPDGELRWDHTSENISYASLPTIDEDGILYIVSEDGTAYAYGEKEKDGDEIPGFTSCVFLFSMIFCIFVFDCKKKYERTPKHDTQNRERKIL